MQSFGAFLIAALLAATVPAGRGVEAISVEAGAEPASEAYVAELDRDWNVTREARVACPVDAGCLVDLALDEPAISAVHVRFDTLRAGSIAVRSRLEDRDGRASPAEDEVLALDRGGFAAGHYEARMGFAGAEARTILVAVRVTGWTAPGGRAAADRT